MEKGRKKVIWIGIIVLWFCALMMINREKLNNFLSNTFAIQEENPEIFIYSDEMPIDGITAEREIIQPLTFSRRVGHIGVKIGTYGRENHSIYEISLLDQWGNVLGMAKEDAANIKDNEYYYIKIERLIIPGQEYYLKIRSDSADEENAITCYASRSIIDQKHVIINGVEQEYSLIMTFMYGKVNNYTSSIAVILLFIYMIYAAYKIADGYKYCLKLKDIVLSKRMHQIILAVFLICFLIAVFNKNTVYKILYTGGEYNADIHVSEAILDDVTIEQTFIYPEDRMNCIEVKFALFLQTFKNGTIHFELYESGNSNVIREGSVSAKDIEAENISFLFPAIENSANKEYVLKIFTTEVSNDNAMSVFYTSNSLNENVLKMHGNIVSGSLVFTAGMTQKEYRWEEILLLGIILLGMMFLYLFRFQVGNRKIVLAVGILFIGCLSGIGLKTYSVYQQISVDGMIKVLVLGHTGEERIYSQESSSYEEIFSRSVRTNGTVYGIMQMMEMHNINTKIDTILIKLSDTSMDKRSYYISIFFDTGNGYNNNENYNVSYIYYGEREILLHIPCQDTVRSMRIDIGKQVTNSNIEWYEKVANVEQIRINGTELNKIDIFYYILIFFTFFFTLSLLYFASRKLNNTEKLTEYSFLVLGIIFGVIMSVLIPIAQIPDEDYHVSHTLCAIGGDNIYEQIKNINKEADVYQVSGLSGEKINISKYQKLLTTRLDTYQLSNIVEKDTLEILKRPGQTLGVLIAILLKMPVFWIYFLGELGGLLVYICVCFQALKLLPDKKELMCIIMLLPMSLQEAGSFSYDSFNNALCFLAIAYILHLSIRKEKVQLKDIVLILGIGILLLYIKTIYAGILLLLAIIPLEQYNIVIGKIHIDKQWIKANVKKTIISVGAGITLLFCIVLISKYEYLVILFQTIINISEIFRLYIRTFIEYGTGYIDSMIACFGQSLDTSVGTWYIVFYLFIMVWMCLYCNSSTENYERYDVIDSKQKIVKKSVIILTAVLMVTVIILSMITSGMKSRVIVKGNVSFGYKMKLLTIIDGVQGRYFIPILPLLLFVPRNIKRIIEPYKKIFVYVITEATTVIYIIYILLQRYWI